MRRVITLLVVAASLCACHRQVRIVGCSTEAIAVNAAADSIQDQDYLQTLAPIKENMEREMSVQIGYAPERLWVGEPECPLLNWATDALWEAAKRLSPKPVDIAIGNMGGMRCEWPAGPVTRQSVFELMPFDNRLVVLTLTGNDILDLCQSFARYGGQGVAGMRVTAVDGKLADVTVGGKPVDPKKNYTVATSDYLSGGADHMDALTRYTELWNSDCLIRELYLDAVQSQDTIRAKVDKRMNLL